MVEIVDRMADGESTPGHTSDPREAKGNTDHLSERGAAKTIRSVPAGEKSKQKN